MKTTFTSIRTDQKAKLTATFHDAQGNTLTEFGSLPLWTVTPEDAMTLNVMEGGLIAEAIPTGPLGVVTVTARIAAHGASPEFVTAVEITVIEGPTAEAEIVAEVVTPKAAPEATKTETANTTVLPEETQEANEQKPVEQQNISDPVAQEKVLNEKVIEEAQNVVKEAVVEKTTATEISTVEIEKPTEPVQETKVASVIVADEGQPEAGVFEEATEENTAPSIQSLKQQ